MKTAEAWAVSCHCPCIAGSTTVRASPSLRAACLACDPYQHPGAKLWCKGMHEAYENLVVPSRVVENAQAQAAIPDGVGWHWAATLLNTGGLSLRA